MTIHFAAAARTIKPHLAAQDARALARKPANDNGTETVEETILHAALKQFAKHGIGAAAHARQQAERAFFANDRETYRWWLGVCRTLDARMAARLTQQTDLQKAANLTESPEKIW